MAALMGKNDLGKCIILLLRRIFQIIVAVGNKSEHTTKGTPLPPPHPPLFFEGVLCQICNNRNVGFQLLLPPSSIYIKAC